MATFVTLGGGWFDREPHTAPDPRSRAGFAGYSSRTFVEEPIRQWRDSLPGVSALAIFQGPEAYITPSWYPTRQETGRVVPTWNYVVVHAHGSSGRRGSGFVEQHVRTLTQHKEAALLFPWSADDAPADFFHGQLAGIIGIEISITRLEGEMERSQNRLSKDRPGVVEGLLASGKPITQKLWLTQVSARDLEQTLQNSQDSSASSKCPSRLRQND